MTFLEKLIKDHPKQQLVVARDNGSYMWAAGCPCDYGYENILPCREIDTRYKVMTYEDCRSCWNREMKSEEQEGKMTGRVGITRNGISIFVEHMPGRKKPCLTVQKGNCIYKVASFNSEETADWFLEIVDEMIVNQKGE